MTNEEFKKLKEDPNIFLGFFNDKETIDNLKCITLCLKIATECSNAEKFTYNVEFKKGDARYIGIGILQEYREDKKVNLIYSITPKDSRSLFFNNFEQAKNFAIEKLNNLVFDPKTNLYFQK